MLGWWYGLVEVCAVQTRLKYGMEGENWLQKLSSDLYMFIYMPACVCM